MARRPARKSTESRLTAVERGIRSLQANDTTIVTMMQEGFARVENRLEQIYNHIDGFMKLHETLDIEFGLSRSNSAGSKSEWNSWKVPEEAKTIAPKSIPADVALERDGRAVACEISVSTNSEQELGNIQKCLAAGFETVLVISPEKKNLAGIREAVEGNLEKNEIDRVRYFTLEDFLTFLDEEEAKAASTEQTVKGWKVKTKHRVVNESERKSRRQAIAQTILQSMKRMRGKD